ncbi:MAG: hypothetical protein KJ958_16190 [Gammaproteobacteria bacterium]|nr:hypothetical protein [Gammaproteobacteria bacterium]MBU1980698.1 hypothetical protein [Gammaproteobacteria bacterium]
MSKIRIKTNWFKKDGQPKDPAETASVLAMILWRLADKFTINLSKADYDIITPERGFVLMAEFLAFEVQYADRLAYNRIDDATRTGFIQALAKRLSEMMEENILAIAPNNDEDYNYKAGFIDLLNRRLVDYATFDLIDEKPGFATLRYLGNCIREVMDKRDQPWIIDQIMDIESPEAVETIKKTMQGLLETEEE